MIQIYTTGGTIDKLYFDASSKYQIGSPAIIKLLEDANISLEYEAESILKKDSLELTDDDRKLIYSKIETCENNRILITHGTDSMVQTAISLQSITGKTIVLTGSMQPAKFRASDALFNVGCAITAVQLLDPGVYVVMNGRVFNPSLVHKNREKICFEDDI